MNAAARARRKDGVIIPEKRQRRSRIAAATSSVLSEWLRPGGSRAKPSAAGVSAVVSPSG